jgi:2-methylisocitrate lyase-like PEP mutase family enzyme
VTDQATLATRFLELHRPGQPLLMPNAWDAGSAKILASLGFEAVATTSSGSAATLGLLDGSVTRAEALANAGAIVAAVDLPVSADLENAFADDSDGVADTIRLAIETGLAGGSVEDFSGDSERPIYDIDLAVERVAAAVQAAHSGPVHFVVTARAENFLHGRPDLDDTIARLRAYADAGADVVFAPGLPDADAIRAVVDAVDVPVNVLVRPGFPSIAELGEMGVARISVGGSFAFAALGGLIDAATELRDQGTYGYGEQTARGIKAAKAAFERR